MVFPEVQREEKAEPFFLEKSLEKQFDAILLQEKMGTIQTPPSSSVKETAHSIKTVCVS